MKIRVMATVGVLLLAMTMGIVGVLETGDEGAPAEAVSASGSSTSVVGGGARQMSWGIRSMSTMRPTDFRLPMPM